MGAQSTPEPTLGRWSMIVSSEHASRALPPRFGSLGLSEETLASHVAWDEGAGPIATRIAGGFGAPLHLGSYSRLLADLNRSPGSAEAVPARAFGVEVPGNHGLNAAEIAERIAEFHAPYWSAVTREARSLAERGCRVLHLSVHSFTDRYPGQIRELDLGLLFDPARPLEEEAVRILERALGAERPALDVRRNEPYDGRADALTTALRGMLPADRYAGIEIEISHKRLGDLDRIGAALITAIASLLG